MIIQFADESNPQLPVLYSPRRRLLARLGARARQIVCVIALGVGYTVIALYAAIMALAITSFLWLPPLVGLEAPTFGHQLTLAMWSGILTMLLALVSSLMIQAIAQALDCIIGAVSTL